MPVVDWSSCDEDEGESGEDGEKGRTKRCVCVCEGVRVCLS